MENTDSARQRLDVLESYMDLNAIKKYIQNHV